jgi:hypothetical protein
MPPKEIHFTRHARDHAADRPMPITWIEATVRTPDWIEQDPNDPSVERRFKRIDANGGRVLRVAVVETDDHIRVLTYHFDRKARPKP